MKLDVSKGFLTPAMQFPFEVEVTLEPQDVNGETVSFDTVSINGTFQVLDDEIHLKGILRTVAHGACAVCLEQADASIEVNFAESFKQNVDETEEEVFCFAGKAVPLDHMALTLVMLNLPMRFECEGKCKSITKYHLQMNEDTMSSCVDGSPTQRPFEALQSLLKKDEEV